MYTTTANQKLVCVKQKFFLRVFVLTRFYCMYYNNLMHIIMVRLGLGIGLLGVV